MRTCSTAKRCIYKKYEVSMKAYETEEYQTEDYKENRTRDTTRLQHTVNLLSMHLLTNITRTKISGMESIRVVWKSGHR